MKSILLISILAIQICFAQTEKQIRFIVHPDNLPDNSVVYITGNNSVLGDWKPDVLPLKKTESSDWEVTISLPDGFHLEYKFTLGSWEQEALDKDGSAPSNCVLDVMNDTIIYVKINSWSNKEKSNAVGQITGSVEYFHNLKGEGINDRDVIVWLPPGYYENSDIRYPVLYMHDGQNIVDPKTSAFGTDWQLDETADSLIKKHLIKPIIIIGVYNTPDRSSEYAANDTGYAYLNFILQKLKPLIDSVYRTLPGRENTATGGSSLAGMISFMLAWEHPEAFSMAICLSPAFKIYRYDFVTPVEQYSGSKKDIKLYIDNGVTGVDSLLQDGIDLMLSALEDKGFIEGKDLYRFKDLAGNHNESSWAKRIWRPLISMFGNKNSNKLIK